MGSTLTPFSRARQLIIRAVNLARIVKSTRIPSYGAWVQFRELGHGGGDYRALCDVNYHSVAYVLEPDQGNTLNQSDINMIGSMWDSFGHILENWQQYRRVTRALKYFDSA